MATLQVVGEARGERSARHLISCLVGPADLLDATRQDADELLTAARDHRLGPALLARHHSAPVLPRSAATRLETLVRLEHLMTRQSRAQLIEILQALDDAGISTIVLKGAANSVLAPGRARLGADHDLLVRPGDLDTVGQVLQTLGYAQRADGARSIEHYRTTHHHDAPWSRPDSRHPVEVHRHPLDLRFEQAYPVDGLWERSVPLPLEPAHALRLGDVDQVIHLAVHCTEDGPARRLRELWELAGWARRLDDSGWETLLALVDDPVLARRVWGGLAAASSVFAPALPAAVLDELAARGGLSAARQRRWFAAVAHTSVDGVTPRWEGWAVRRALEASSGPASVAAAIGGAWAWSVYASGLSGPSGIRRALRASKALVMPALQGWRPPQRAVRRLFDIAGALVLGVLALPLVAVLALALRMRSPGPAVYRQVRVGRHGRPFELLKLRTMPVDAERATGPRLSPPADPRIVNGFAWVRRTHLDELPQLWNVLVGEMSLVGPRPERPEFTAVLRRGLPAYDERHQLRPGLTGQAQIRVGYHAPGVAKLAHDLAWVRKPALRSYLRILLATPWSIITGPADRDADPDFADPDFADPVTLDLTDHDDVATSVA